MKVIENFNPTIYKHIFAFVPGSEAYIKLSSDGLTLVAEEGRQYHSYISVKELEVYKKEAGKMEKGFILGDVIEFRGRFVIFYDFDKKRDSYASCISAPEYKKRNKEAGSRFNYFVKCEFYIESYFKDEEVRDFLEDIL